MISHCKGSLHTSGKLTQRKVRGECAHKSMHRKRLSGKRTVTRRWVLSGRFTALRVPGCAGGKGLLCNTLGTRA